MMFIELFKVPTKSKSHLPIQEFSVLTVQYDKDGWVNVTDLHVCRFQVELGSLNITTSYILNFILLIIELFNINLVILLLGSYVS